MDWQGVSFSGHARLRNNKTLNYTRDYGIEALLGIKKRLAVIAIGRYDSDRRFSQLK